MKKIILKEITLENFKGIKNLSIQFDEKSTSIYGANGTGKTTISDAINWLWFGKNSLDQKDFEVKTLDEKGKVINMIEHSVYAEYLIDCEQLTIKRILKENLVKKRGFEEREFAGNVTDLYWNEVPVNLTTFNKKVDEILNEKVFKMLTSPVYFNSTHWTDRRSLLIQIFGEVSDDQVAGDNESFKNLISNLTQGKTLDDYKKQISASIKKAKEDIASIPDRIDEVHKGKPETYDFVSLENILKSKQNQLSEIDKSINDSNNAFDEKNKKQRELKLEISQLETENLIFFNTKKTELVEFYKPDTRILDSLINQKLSKESEIKGYESTVNSNEKLLTENKEKLSALEIKIEDKRKEWHKKNAESLVFNKEDFSCPTCKRAFENSDIESKKSALESNFNDKKVKDLHDLKNDGLALTNQKTELENAIQSNLSTLDICQQNLDNAKKQLQEIVDKIDIENAKQVDEPKTEAEINDEAQNICDNIAEYNDRKVKINELKAKYVEIEKNDNTELINSKNAIQTEIDSIKKQLQNKELIEKADARILELKNQQKTLAQQIANVEKEQFVIESFIKAKVEALEKTVNSKFKLVNFKMFDDQMNGGYKETCEVTVNGVPYSDLNTASRINAGIDVINVLSEHFGICAPIVIDNAESVHTLIDTNSQLVRLVVSESDKKLKIK